MNPVFNDNWREYVADTARCRGIDLNDEDEMNDLQDELAWEWLDIEAERDAGNAVIIDGEF